MVDNDFNGEVSKLFSPLEIVCCNDCSHTFNRAYDENNWKTTYSNTPLSCKAVHSSMFNYLDKTVEWIGIDNIKDKLAMEIGSGSGDFARKLSLLAKSVICYEPNQQLTKKHLPENNIELVNDQYSSQKYSQKYELIVCKQELEHIAAPVRMLIEIRNAVIDGGMFYLEVPSFEFIKENSAFFDFHSEHVQYFSKKILIYIAEKVGFRLIKEHLVKNGHDIAMLFTTINKDNTYRGKIKYLNRIDFEETKHLIKQLQSHYQYYNDVISKTNGNIALYGATSQTSSFLSSIKQLDKVEAIFDDNPDNANMFLLTLSNKIPVTNGTHESLTNISVIFIGAYLHQAAIIEQLDHTDFKGKIIPLVKL